MKTWHFLQPSNKLWRTWKLDWIPGNTQLETPSCIIQQVRHWVYLGWLQTVFTAFLYVIEQLLQVMLWFFFFKVVFKKWVFFLFSLASDSKVWSCSICHWKAHLYYRSTCFQQPQLFPGLSSLWTLVIFVHCFLLLKESSLDLLVCLLLSNFFFFFF